MQVETIIYLPYHSWLSQCTCLLRGVNQNRPSHVDIIVVIAKPHGAQDDIELEVIGIGEGADPAIHHMRSEAPQTKRYQLSEGLPPSRCIT